MSFCLLILTRYQSQLSCDPQQVRQMKKPLKQNHIHMMKKRSMMRASETNNGRIVLRPKD